jgi:NTE family protein
VADLDRDGGPWPPLPRLRIGSPRLALGTAIAPHRVHPWVAASAWVLEGRGRLDSVSALTTALAGTGPWPGAETWIMAVDYEAGRRIAFGRPGAPAAALPEAVVASCSIPGWYEPKVIAGRRYVDGGVRSSTSLDLLSRVDLDEVYVLAPMASYAMDRPLAPSARLERLFRKVVTLALTREARKVRATGTVVHILTPGPDDLAAMGVNLMDPSRRLRVLETSLQTSAAALDRPSSGLPRAA